MIASGMISQIKQRRADRIEQADHDEHHERQHVRQRPGQRGPGVARSPRTRRPIRTSSPAAARSLRSSSRTRLNSWLGRPVRGSAWTVSVGKRSRRMTTGSSQTTSVPEVTWLSGIIRPATGLQICRLLIMPTSSRSASGGRATIGSSRVSCGNMPRAGAARLAVETDDAAFEAGLQRLRHFDARDAVAAGLQLEQVGPDHLLALAPIAADADARCRRLRAPSCAWSPSCAQHGRIGAAEAGLDAAALRRARAETSWRRRWRWGTARRDAAGCRQSSRRSSPESSTSTRNCTNARFSLSGE